MKLLLENWRKVLKEEQEFPYQIYCDMDGVLVDFEKGVVDQINRDLNNLTIVTKEMRKLRIAIEEATRDAVSMEDIDKFVTPRTPLIRAARNYMYKRFANDVDFWAKLPWMPDGPQLWEAISRYNPNILTAPMGPGSAEGKRLWIEKNLNPLGPPKEIFISKDKDQWDTTDGRANVLIDDFTTNTGPWLKAGGFAILHTNTADTINTLEVIGQEATEKNLS